MSGHPSSLGACHPGGHPLGRDPEAMLGGMPAGHPGAQQGGHPGGHPGAHPHASRFLPDGSPKCRLIAWEVTRSCNLACKHCRAEAHPEPYPG